YILHHVGMQVRAQLSANQRLEISPYMQYRDIDHPIFEVISQISHDYGVEMRYENTHALGSLDNRFTLGFQPAYESLLNRQYENNQGEHGALTKDQHDHAKTVALYAENVLSLTPQFSAVLGLRAERASRQT